MKKVLYIVLLILVGFVLGLATARMLRPSVDYQQIAFSLVDARDLCCREKAKEVDSKLTCEQSYFVQILAMDPKGAETRARIKSYLGRNPEMTDECKEMISADLEK